MNTKGVAALLLETAAVLFPETPRTTADVKRDIDRLSDFLGVLLKNDPTDADELESLGLLDGLVDAIFQKTTELRKELAAIGRQAIETPGTVDN